MDSEKHEKTIPAETPAGTDSDSAFYNAPGVERLTITLPIGVKCEMVKVEPGAFLMGRISDKTPNKCGVRTVVLTDPFWLARTTVTREQWNVVMCCCTEGEVQHFYPSVFPLSGIVDNYYPVSDITWDEAKLFMQTLNRACADQLPRGYVFDLPTEAQWEYAAQGGHKRMEYTMYSGSNRESEVGIVYAHDPQPVAQKKPNELGIYDMTGNVEEWCSNWYAKPSPQKMQINPVGPATGKHHITKGGNYHSGRRELQNWWSNAFSHHTTGIRIAIVRKNEI